MRTYELLCAGLFVGLMLAAAAGLRGRRRSKALGLGAVGLVVVWTLPRIEGLPGGGVLRDFLPVLILLLTYWQSGQFVVVRETRFQEYLGRLDRRWLPWLRSARAQLAEQKFVTAFLEAAYLMCYPMLPLGVMALYALGRADLVAAYWLVVVPAISLCQTATIPFQSWPPWLAFPDEAPTLRRSALREMNEWVTDYASIRANTFPSGHVAGSFAIALFLFTVSPGFGLLFFGIAMSTSVSTVLLGYHYSLDVVLGLVVGAASFLVLR